VLSSFPAYRGRQYTYKAKTTNKKGQITKFERRENGGNWS